MEFGGTTSWGVSLVRGREGFLAGHPALSLTSGKETFIGDIFGVSLSEGQSCPLTLSQIFFLVSADEPWVYRARARPHWNLGGDGSPVTGPDRLIVESSNVGRVARATEPSVSIGELVGQILFLSLGLINCEENTPLCEVLWELQPENGAESPSLDGSENGPGSHSSSLL